ncbi:MAG TPA: carboxypeptidase-like regulatory domain-containing protein, partial [Pyrinomonadaceae bacterium]|nr:carboxypeptidase-like regulatory domain-containing protein [Pyrinomonadaceae bacterium]
VSTTQRQKPAIYAWTGATISEFRPFPGIDGAAYIAYKVTQTSANTWHYEYAVYNQNLDRAIQSLSIPTGTGVTLSNVGFYAPPQQAGSNADGTMGSAGFSNTPWSPVQGSGAITWATESLAQNPNANAIRWSTMYNFRFDSNRPPTTGNATVGFFKTGAPFNVQVQVPSPALTSVTVAGRVTSTNGQGINGVRVSLTDTSSGARISATTNAFGNYQFNNITPGISYTIAPVSKRYSFTPVTTTINDNISNLDFTGTPL